MSYILEALKHSQERRTQGAVPDLSSQCQPGSAAGAQERFWRRLALATVAILVLVLVVLGWQGWRVLPTDARLATPGTVQEPAVSAASPEPSATLAPAVPALALAAEAAQAAEVATLAELTPDSTTLRALQSMAGVRVELGAESGAALPTPVAPIQRLPAAQEVGRVPLAGPVAATRLPERPAVLPENPPRRVEAEEESGMPGDFGPLEHWRQLPGSLQQQLREQPISAHVYASDPLLRFVRHGGRTLREGDALSAELRVLHITRSGVILGYRNGKYWLRLG